MTTTTTAVLPKYLYFIPFFFAVSAFALAFVGTSCRFVQFTAAEEVPNPVSGESGSATLFFGQWYHSSRNVTNSTVPGESCVPYDPSVDVDDYWKASRGCNLIAIVAGGSVLLLDTLQGCVSTKRNRSFRTGAVMYMICCVSSGLSLLLLESDVCKNNVLIRQLERVAPGIQFPEACTISTGGKSSIAAAALWFAASVSTAFLHPWKNDGKDGEGDGDDGLDEPLFRNGPGAL